MTDEDKIRNEERARCRAVLEAYVQGDLCLGTARDLLSSDNTEDTDKGDSK